MEKPLCGCYTIGVSIRPRRRPLVLSLAATAVVLSLAVCTNPTFIEFTRYVAPAPVRPAGFDSDLQWNMEMINAPGAWAIMNELNAQGGLSAPIAVAVIDSGVHHNENESPSRPPHPGLSAHILFAFGRDFSIGGTDPHLDQNGHGTHVAGTIVALPHGSSDVMIGVGHPWSRAISVKVLDANGDGTTVAVALGIDYAVHLRESGQLPSLRVLNLSLGGHGASDVRTYSAIERAVSNGMMVVAAAGNMRGGPDVVFPAAFENTIAVASVGPTAVRSSFSSYGPESGFAAPGEAIWSTAPPTTNYAYNTGTSMATPHVAGVAALLYAVEPGLNQDAVYSILRATARDLGAPGWDKYYGHGLVDAQAALEYLINLRSRTPRTPMGQELGGRSRGVRIDVGSLSGAQLPPSDAEIDGSSVIVRFSDGAAPKDEAELLSFAERVSVRIGAATVRRIGADTAVIQLQAGQPVLDALSQVAELPGVQFSQPNYIYRAVW